MDIAASIGLLVGAVLIALGAIGLVRFPDVITRMHAATKAATVGVIATTTAAAAEAGAVGGTLVLLLVVALLFLSAPLGMSVLARAAYHDPETVHVSATAVVVPHSPSLTKIPRPRRPGTSLSLAAWLLVAWVALFGSIEPHVVLGGAAVAGGTAFAFRRLAPRWPIALAHPIAVARFLALFLRQLVGSTWEVISALRLQPHELEPSIIEIPLRVRTRTEVTLLMNSISFTPGSVALELADGRVFVHVLDTDDPAAVVADIRRLEDRIAAMIGPSSK